MLKKDLPDKDTVCEIRFQGSRNNGAHNITMLVHLTLSSRQFKQWAQSQSLPNGDVSGVFYANQLGYLTPRKDWRHWQLAGASLPHSVRGIVADLQQYALPLCDLFTDKAATVAYLRQHGSALNPWLDNTKTCTPAFFITPSAAVVARRRAISSATISAPAAIADAMPIFTPP